MKTFTLHPKPDEIATLPLEGIPTTVEVEVVSQGSAPEPAVAMPVLTFASWLPLLYIMAITAAELAFIECYCHWHGAQFLFPNPFNLYSADNIARLSKINFVGGSPASTMDFTAEILMWASLGVWSQRIASMSARYKKQAPNPPHDLTEYIGILGCHTSIAAALMIVLKLSGFKVFGISLDSFEATAGTAFILGYFGKQTEELLTRIRDQVFGKKNLPKEHENQHH